MTFRRLLVDMVHVCTNGKENECLIWGKRRLWWKQNCLLLFFCWLPHPIQTYLQLRFILYGEPQTNIAVVFLHHVSKHNCIRSLIVSDHTASLHGLPSQFLKHLVLCVSRIQECTLFNILCLPFLPKEFPFLAITWTNKACSLYLFGFVVLMWQEKISCLRSIISIDRVQHVHFICNNFSWSCNSQQYEWGGLFWSQSWDKRVHCPIAICLGNMADRHSQPLSSIL